MQAETCTAPILLDLILSFIGISQVTIPGKKRAYRLYGREGYALCDLMIGENEPPPKVIICMLRSFFEISLIYHFSAMLLWWCEYNLRN